MRWRGGSGQNAVSDRHKFAFVAPIFLFLFLSTTTQADRHDMFVVRRHHTAQVFFAIKKMSCCPVGLHPLSPPRPEAEDGVTPRRLGVTERLVR